MVGPEGTKRISKIDTYLNVAEAFAYRSTCIKRKYGTVFAVRSMLSRMHC